MIANTSRPDTAPFVEKMRAAGVPEQAIATFIFHLERYLQGNLPILDREAIAPVERLPDAAALGEHRASGTAALDRVVVIKLNGGLGTGMGLERAKSLLEVRQGLSFLDLIVRQVQALRQRTGARIPLLLMNSFRTAADTAEVLERYPDLATRGLPLGFLQHRVPKILNDGALPACHPTQPDLEWCPPGHGDLYTAMATSGTLDRLLEEGIEYAFVSNADNLGAVLEPTILGSMADSGLGFIIEAADRTPADRKGGHLCRLASGRLALRESAQCPPDEKEQFQDVALYRYFNTNNIWIHLPSLAELGAAHDGVLPLATIVNQKTLDPRDPESPPVVQLETAMGAAVSLFERAAAVRVPRSRFSPVKNTDDLLSVRSDAYRLTDDYRIVLDARRDAPPVVSLENRFYKMIDDFEARFPEGAPSLLECRELRIEGNVFFSPGVVVRGTAHVRGPAGRTVIPSGSVLSGELDLEGS
jgi:UTP--glucose-1-phosphate uridylyltransferase